MNRNPTATILSSKMVFGSKAAPQVAPFSSKGPNSVTPEILKVKFLHTNSRKENLVHQVG